MCFFAATASGGSCSDPGWLATAARHALSHHHPESFASHLLVKLCGPKRTVAVATGAAAGRAAFAAAAAGASHDRVLLLRW